MGGNTEGVSFVKRQQDHGDPDDHDRRLAGMTPDLPAMAATFDYADDRTTPHNFSRRCCRQWLALATTTDLRGLESVSQASKAAEMDILRPLQAAFTENA